MIAIHKVTIKDVAKEAGVSISTVSNALNNVDVLKPDTKEHILEVADRLNYIPNLNGKNLKASATKVIGFFITSIAGPYYSVLADSLYTACNDAGYGLIIYITQSEKAAMTNILGQRIDGAIIFDDWIKEKQIETLKRARIPIVFLDREIQAENMSSVLFDSYAGGKMITEYMIKAGHKKIGYLHGYLHTYDDQERFRGFCDAIHEAGVEFCDYAILEGRFEEAAAYAVIKEYIQSGKPMVDAFFAANDISAIGCIKALKDSGYHVPSDVSVVGCDDIDLCEFFRPPITTINNPIRRQGMLAVEQLLKTIQGQGKGTVEKLHGRLVIRESCKIAKEN